MAQDPGGSATGAGAAALGNMLGDSLTPEEKARLTAGTGGGADITYVPWWGVGLGRAKDLEAHSPTGDAASSHWSDVIEGAKGNKVEGTKLPAVIPYAEMTQEEAFATNAPLTPGQEEQQRRRDEGRGEIMKDASQVVLDVYNWTDEEAAEVGRQMVAVGLIPEIYDRKDLLGAWSKLVGDAIDYNTAKPGSLFTPLDMLDINYGAGPGSKGKKGPSVETTISRSLSISTNDDARSMLGNMMARELGRRPTAAEVDKFQGTLNAAQRANPRTTTTVSTPGSLSKSGKNESYSTTTGGIDDQAVAERAVISDDPDSEYGKYQAATTYANALFQAIRTPV